MFFMINRQFFFDHARTALFKGALSKSQVGGLTYILDVWEEDHPDWDDRWLAYALGTTHLETGATMQPIGEGGGNKYFELNYGPEGRNPPRAKKMGNTHSGDGAKYRGRGFVQLTWKNNYQTLGTHLSKAFGKPIDLVANPELALEPDYAAEIMFFGMSAGTFTGRKFSDYFTTDKNGKPVKDNWLGARAIINGNDKAQVIANFGKDYYSCLSHI
jgi:putative chitinase